MLKVRMMSGFEIIGHRGAAGIAPENTLSGINKAIELCSTIEIDARATKEGVVVLHHDRKLDRMTNGKGVISETSYDVLRKYDVYGERIPMLKEAIELIDDRVGVHIEIKDTRSTDKVIEIINESYLSNVAVTSRYRYQILKVREKLGIPIGLVVLGLRKSTFKWVKKHEIDFIVVLAAFLRKRMIRRCHENGIKVYAYPYGGKSMLKKKLMENMGVDGAYFNYPGKKPF